MPLVFLRDGASELSHVVTKLFLKCLEERKTLEQWKVAQIIPLYKKGDKDNQKTIDQSAIYAQSQRFMRGFFFIFLEKFKKWKRLI